MSSDIGHQRTGQAQPVETGVLVLVVGPSGAGKDTLMRLAAARLGPDSGVVFARRIITRPPDESEANEEIDEAGFREAERAGAFALAWRAHGHCYAISAEVLTALQAGRTVVVNTSRRVIAEACARFKVVRVVMITAAPKVLAARLAARGRDPDAAARLSRDVPAHAPAPTLVIENEAAPEAAADRLAAYLLAARSG